VKRNRKVQQSQNQFPDLKARRVRIFVNYLYCLTVYIALIYLLPSPGTTFATVYNNNPEACQERKKEKKKGVHKSRNRK